MTVTFFAQRVAVATALACTAAAAQAADFTLNGTITFHNDVVQIDCALAAPGVGVKI